MRRNIVFGTIITLLVAAFIASPVHSRRKESASERVMGVIGDIESNLKETKYQHWTSVRASKGQYFFDCSGMASWILRRSAPGSLSVIGKPNGRRPLAVHFYRQIAKIKPGKRRGPWYRVESAAHIEPGDVIAWVRPKWFPSKSTGHVGFAVSESIRNHGEVPGYLMRFADASKFKHEDDSRSAEVTGYGTGVLLIPTDTDDQPIGYGWFGSRTKSDWIVPTELVIGRPLR